MDGVKTTQPEAVAIFERVKALGKTQRELAGALGVDENKVSKVKIGERQFRAGEVLRANAWLDNVEALAQPDLPEAGGQRDYLPVEVLPSFAGMGGGGTGEGDPTTALVPRTLIVDVLRGKPTDFIVIDVRGDSMEPDFRHGDQILVDKRDRSPAQPGPFALWDGEWGEYLVKNVERSEGRYRIFSSNPKYQPQLVEAEQTRIIGRPVWFGRRL